LVSIARRVPEAINASRGAAESTRGDAQPQSGHAAGSSRWPEGRSASKPPHRPQA